MNRKNTLLASAGIIAAAALALSAAAQQSAPAPTAAAPAAPPSASAPAPALAPLPTGARAAADALFADATAMGETRALVVLRDGEVIFERYGEGFGANTKLISWSMAKSITAALIGILVADGRLVLDDPAPVPAWQRPGDPRGDITLRQLLHMSSGLNHVEVGEPVWESDTVRMLFGDGAGDMAGYAESQPPVARPGELYQYSSATSVILSDIATRALTTSEAPAVRRDTMRNFIAARFAGPLGMTSLTPEFDASGTLIGGSIMHATARDYGRFGEFLRSGGVAANGQRILPARWVDFMRTPSTTDGGYGGHIWLNRPRPARSDPAMWPGQGPADIFACLGHQGQFIIVSPSQRLTVVRLGISTRPQIGNVRDQLRRMITAL